VFQTSYSFKEMLERNLMNFALSKSLNNFFSLSVFVNVAAKLSLDRNKKERYGVPSIEIYRERFFFIDLPAGRFFLLRYFEKINFCLIQISLFWALREFVKEKEPVSVVRGEDPRINGLLAIIYSKYFRVPSVIGVWGNPERIRLVSNIMMNPRIFKSQLTEKKFESFVLRHSKMILVQNDENRSYVLSMGVNSSKIFVFRLGNAIEKQHFLPLHARGSTSLTKLRNSENRFLVGTVSRLEKLKMVDHTLEIFSRMRNVNRSFLLLFGDGSQKSELRVLAKQLGIENRLIFLGNVEQVTLAADFCELDLVISPLMAVVAYDIDCHPEIVIDGKTGFLVPVGEWELAAAKCDQLLEDSKLAQDFGFGLRQFLLDYMDPGRLIREQREMFQLLLGRDSGA